jgi:hypothetical protein
MRGNHKMTLYQVNIKYVNQKSQLARASLVIEAKDAATLQNVAIEQAKKAYGDTARLVSYSIYD